MKEPRTREYREYLNSLAWNQKRHRILARAKHRCEHCGKAGVALEVHHKHYETLFDETPDDLVCLCIPCHDRADARRKAQNERLAEERAEERWFRNWARKVYGENWEAIEDEEMHERFNEHCERQESRDYA